MNYYYTDATNQTRGPVSVDQLGALAATGELGPACMVAAVGTQQWMPISSVLPGLSAAAPPTTEPLAIWSLVLSIVGLACCGCTTALPGIICGHIALSQLRAHPHRQGAGLAIAGLIIGYFSLIAWLLYLFVFGGLAFLQALVGTH